MRSGLLASIIADDLAIAATVPWACPCDFGPDGRYHLEELVSAGSRSLVYKAVDRSFSSQGFEATVAVKIFRPGHDDAIEALATRRISHPNVLAVLDRGREPGGAAYLVSEYVSGGDLSETRTPWEPRKAAAFIARIARGVQAAHSAGIIHCDLKPANILLTEDGEPKLADFELSRWSDLPAGASRGNVAFMSPEQFRDEPDSLTPPSDIYALGGLLYWLLTGSLPNGETPEHVARTHRQPGQRPYPHLRGDLVRICERALAADRTARHHSAGELAEDLERWLKHLPLTWAPPPAHRRLGLWMRRRPWLAAAYIIIAVTGAMAVVWWQVHVAQERRHREQMQIETVRLAEQQVEEIRAKVRAHIRYLAEGLTSGDESDLQDRLMPAMVWIQWLGDSPLIAESGDLHTVHDRVALLRKLISAAEVSGRSGHLDDVVARYALAYFLVDLGQAEEARELLQTVRDAWASRIDPDDAMWHNILGVEDCAKAVSDIRAGDAAGGLATLTEVRIRLAGIDGAGPVRRLAERITRRAAAAR